MMMIILTLLKVFLLFTVQVSFIHTLPFPFDHVPLVLVATIYSYQYANRTASWWWLPGYGLLLDVLGTSLAPMEWFSYGLVTATLVLLARHVFTNTSFYGMAATALLSLLVLSISQLLLTGAQQLFSSDPFYWKLIVISHAWMALFACILLLFIFPWVKNVKRLTSQWVLTHL